MSKNGACTLLPQANTERKRFIDLKCCQLCNNVILHTCESCVRKGVASFTQRLSIRPRSLSIRGDGPGGAARSEARPAAGVGWGGKPSEAQADHEKKPRS